MLLTVLFSVYDGMIVHCMAILHLKKSLHQFVDIYIVSTFLITMNSAAKNIDILVFLVIHVFISLGKIPKSRIAQSYDKFKMCNFS